ncbi:hypothetical protein N5A92_23435 [Chelativorans sp. EGI FJ00035]|uniref:Uncharacterized protein n=1 Tax=Chelativorans salis TaxID=2978478 RepID=A0ABT2LTX4_9HYPH|nr:hypothetical protein [Chelativorans sp. EGI FJ00035]
MSEDLQQERNRLANRLREQLWRYYPQMLDFGGDPAAAWRIALWRLAPTPADAARLRALPRHCCRGKSGHSQGSW